MKQTPKDDIAIQFYADGIPAGGIRIASRHGEETAARILARLRPLLRPGVKLRCWIETPSRFLKEPSDKITMIVDDVNQGS